MAVRFLPPPGDPEPSPGEDRADLAEVIELRSLLRQRSWVPAPEDSGDPAGISSNGDGAFDESRAPVGIQAPVEGVASIERRARGEESVLREGVSQEDASTNSAYADGVRLLARKARSSGELREDLLRLEHEPFEVDAVIDEFERSHYLDDLGLARLLTEKLRDTKRASRTQIRMKLRERRLPDGAIEEALGELDDEEEFELLRSAAQDRARRLGDLDRQTAERRLLGFLARRGWSGERAVRAAREALDGTARPSSGGVRFR